MTNNWVDLDNSSLFLMIGANPAENHPAFIGHMNVARFDLLGRGRNAGLIVVDPRLTRTARMIGVPYDASNPNDMRRFDRFVRIRPGTNIAFVNGVINRILEIVYEARSDSSHELYQVAQNFFAWHNNTAPNSTANRVFIADSGATVTVTGWPKYCDSRLKVTFSEDGTTADYVRETRTVGSETISNFPVLAADVDDNGCVLQALRRHVAKYDVATTADICGCTTDDIEHVATAWLYNSRFASSDFGAATGNPAAAGYRAACINYAMGATQFTTGSQGVRTYAIIQTLLGNMGRQGGGINALRGIHNVQGSTDMGVLFDFIPGYSRNPKVGETYANYSNELFGNRVVGTGAKDPYDPSQLGLQQRGFYNMTVEWFGERRSVNNRYSASDFDKLYACWPKGNGYDHITAFRKMLKSEPDATRVKAAVVWGQNPAVTEPNQSAVREGLYDLDLLVVVDMFANETAQCSRKDTGVTYLLPACSHVEEAGSVTNSGRWIQWRDRARPPKGNSKADLELLLRFAKALHAAGAFSHIEAQWATMASPPSGNAWQVLFAKYGWDGTGDFESVSGTDAEGVTLYGSEYVAEQIFKEMASPLNGNDGDSTAPAGTIWIYSGNGGASAYNANKIDGWPAINRVKGMEVWSGPNKTGTKYADSDYSFDADFGKIARTSTSAIPDGATVYVSYQYGNSSGWTPVDDEQVTLSDTTGVQLSYKSLAPLEATWEKANRAKSRMGAPEYASDSLQYPRYGWAWLLNRRIFYNNGEVTGDVSDGFVAPGYLARLVNINTNTLADWSTLYRTYSTLLDKPDTGVDTQHVYAGRFPSYTEPYESPRPDLVAVWGHNTRGTAGDLLPAGTARGTVDQYPLVLTTIRCVEHFQGGPITRNNPWNHEMEPEPWIEINSVDAIKYGIKDGDWVNVITARSNSTSDELGRSKIDGDSGGFAKGFRARVGVGTVANQRVAPGVVAIPWHWGERGLSKGSRANDLTIDANDANTRIPEYKACLCKIQKA